MTNNALVIGATGLLGYGITCKLSKTGWNVRAISKDAIVDPGIFPKDVEYICGDFYDESFLLRALKGIDKVFFTLSSTFPTTSPDSLELEISSTLRGLDYLLRSMRAVGVSEIVFPSSGGTIYGSIESGTAREIDELKPITSYGVGMKMCEEVLAFYSQFGISATILRVGNVYGTPFTRDVSQGVIDVFVQNALNGDGVTVWGDSIHSIRDYIYTEDFSDAVALISDYKSEGVEVYNLGTGIGTALDEVIKIIDKYLPTSLDVNYINDNAIADIKRIVLNVEKFSNKTGWEPKYDIENGIRSTIERKRMNKLL